MKKFSDLTVQDLADLFHLPVWLFILLSVVLSTFFYSFLKKLFASF